MTTMTNAEALREAERLYLLDATHHAQVEVVVGMLDNDLYENTRRRMNSDDRSLATLAASLAIVVSRLNPQTGEPL